MWNMIARIAGAAAAAGFIALGAGAVHAGAVTGDNAPPAWAATCETGPCGSDPWDRTTNSDPWDTPTISDPWD